jgi:hypothetical protein
MHTMASGDAGVTKTSSLPIDEAHKEQLTGKISDKRQKLSR